jgi:DNA-binding MarR family transcriptional regulator
VARKQISVERGTGRAVAWLARQLELVLAEHDLTLAQYRLLTVLEERPEVASALADKLTVSRPSITTVADGLVARGLVDRVNDTEDRRRVNHALTDAGRALLHHTDEVIDSGLSAVLDHLDPGAARGIAAGFGSLRVLIDRATAEYGPS